MEKNQFMQQFLEEIPELKKPYADMYRGMRLAPEDGIYALWGFGIMPCVKSLLEEPEAHHGLLQRIFTFFEQMANSEDTEVQDFLICGTLESLDDTPKMLETACKYMGPRTTVLWHRVEDFWNLRWTGEEEQNTDKSKRRE